MVIPFLVFKKKFGIQLISDISNISYPLNIIVDIGVYGATIVQFLFSYFLIKEVDITGGICLLIGSVFFGFAGFINIKKNRSLHTKLIKYYSVFLFLSLFIASYHILWKNIVGLVQSLVVLVGFLSAFLLCKVGKKWQGEIVAIVISNFWAILLYLFVI